MINLFKRWLRRNEAAGQDPAPVAPPPVQAVASVDPPDPFDPLWERLGAPPEAPAPLPGDPGQVERLAERVMDHFLKNPPDPTAFPSLAVQIIDLLNEPEVDMARLLKAISPEPAIAITILRVANSALYGRGTEVSDLRLAVMRIGLRGVGEIAAGVAGRSLFDVETRVEFEVFGPRWHQMFQDTMAVAFGASQFAFEQGIGKADQAFLAGMFHDLGRTQALRALAALTVSGELPPPPPEVVDAVLDRVGVDLGVRLHALWGLPEHLREICRRQHDPDLPAGLEWLDAHLLRLAAGLHRLVRQPEGPVRLGEARQSIAALGLVKRNVRRMHQVMADQDERVKVLFPA